MRAAWLWLVPTLVGGSGVFGGCGGESDGRNPSGVAGGGSAGGGGTGGGGTGAGGNGTAQGGTGAMAGAANSAGESSVEKCNPTDCGPQLGLPNWTCADNSVGGPTGRCIERPGGSCGWEVNDCPPAGEGGAANQGGQGNAAGASGVGGAETDPCGGCAPSAVQICVYQAGGPGPSHFTCATQNPCGALTACGCVEGQGTCQPNLMGDPPGYCVCDNGLE